MDSDKIENLIVKYLSNEATSSDLDFLSEWIENPDNERFFINYVKIHYEVTTAMSEPDVDSIKKNLLQKIKKDKNPFYRYDVYSILKYAAIITIFLGIGYLYQKSKIDYTGDFVNEVAKEKILRPNDESITIQLDDGSLQIINTDDENEIRDKEGNLIGAQKKSQLNYVGAANIEKLVYNILTVPYGKRFDVILSDGTRVYLNSGSSLRYPVKFINGVSTRDVFLKGEAYFDVAKNKINPFIVHADEMNIRVLGTRFNISHYSEDKNINTVLVEGSVELYGEESKNGNAAKSTLLKPGFKAEWNKSNKEIVIENVNTRIYTAWIEGKLIFRNASFLHIRNTLERHYNVIIKNNNKDLDAQLFDATFDIETINEVLETFSKSYAIDYDIVDNEIIIK